MYLPKHSKMHEVLSNSILDAIGQFYFLELFRQQIYDSFLSNSSLHFLTW